MTIIKIEEPIRVTKKSQENKELPVIIGYASFFE